MIELLRKRRSIGVYEDRSIEPEKIEILKVESVISMGYPAEKKPGVPKEKLQFNKIRMNRW